jgi:hypothetical protein
MTTVTVRGLRSVETHTTLVTKFGDASRGTALPLVP